MSRISRILVAAALVCAGSHAAALERVQYNHPGLTVDLGVGLWAWPLPMDFDRDGDLDLVVSCPDVPYSGIYFFENPGGDTKMPVFQPPAHIGNGLKNVRVSYVDGHPRVLTPGREWLGFLDNQFKTSRKIHEPSVHGGKVRANQWHYVDHDGDGALDLIVGVGDWSDYGWDDAFNKQGEWTRGPLHGYVYLLRNNGTTEEPRYARPVKVQAGGKPIDVYGMPSPNAADFDGDGDLDLLCGEFLDGFTYFQNIGTRTEPRYAAPRRLTHSGQPLAMDLQMITPTAVDWDGDGDMDLIVGDEDGRVALVEHTGRIEDGLPLLLPPQYFQQQARDLKFGALVTPVSVDWDGDGDEDLVCGNTAGHIGFLENLDGGNPPRWAAPRLRQAAGKTIRIQAGPNGSIQGPAEAKWGYTTLSAADWDHDGLLDLVVNSIWGKVIWYRNVGTSTEPQLAARPVEVRWNGKPPKPDWNWWDPRPGELVTQWRTTPAVIDLNQDGLSDLAMLDHEGYLAWFERVRRRGRLLLLPGKRIFTDKTGEPLRLSDGHAGRSGRRKLCFADWDGDGRIDLLVNGKNANFFRNVSTKQHPWAFADMGPVSDHRLAGHTTSPTTVDWNRDGRPELLLGAEDGRFYYLENPYSPRTVTVSGLKIRGNRLEIGKLDNEELAFANRKYVWFDVPENLQGWHFTRTRGGEPANISVTTEDGEATIYLATAPSQQGIDLSAWRKVDGATFGYTDRGRTRVQVFRRTVPAGEQVAIPQGNWSGGILLIPPEGDSKLKSASKDEQQVVNGETTDPQVANRSDGSRPRPNVLFIAVDDLRVELGCYGDTLVKSPHIDRLAKRGTLFKRAYCQQAVCNPSRASLLTGLRPDTIGVTDLPTHFRENNPDLVTLPQLFRQHGYFTQNIGKIFHNWRQEIHGDPASWSVPAVMHYNTHGADKPQVEGKLPPDTSGVPRTEQRDVPDDAYFDGRIAKLAVEALGELKEKRQPFFLAVGFWKPHAPFNAPQRYWDLYKRGDVQPPANPQPPEGVPAIAMHDSREILRGFRDRQGGRPTDAEVLALRHAYYAATSYVDAQVGKVLDELDRLGLREKTIVVFWSDHGFHLGEHHLWAKTSNFELDARVPLIIDAPNFKDGLRTDALVELLDLYPTLADLCGLPAPENLEGESLRKVLEDPKASVKSAAFTQHTRPAYPSDASPLKAMGYSMRTDDHRYTEWRSVADGRILARELYDHRTDPRETKNLANDSRRAKTVESLGEQLGAHLAAGRRQRTEE